MSYYFFSYINEKNKKMRYEVKSSFIVLTYHKIRRGLLFSAFHFCPMDRFLNDQMTDDNRIFCVRVSKKEKEKKIRKSMVE